MNSRPTVWSCNEWDPLGEVIVGNPAGLGSPPPIQAHASRSFPTGPSMRSRRAPFPSGSLKRRKRI